MREQPEALSSWLSNRAFGIVSARLQAPTHMFRRVSSYGPFGAWEARQGIPPKYSVANTVGFLKGKSEIRIHRQFLGQKRHFTGCISGREGTV